MKQKLRCMNREEKKLLHDIFTSVENIEAYLGKERNFENYRKHKMLKHAVERNIEIIGEAMGQLLRINPDIKITDGRKVSDTRNRIIHGYDSVDDATIWAIVINHLPVLKKEISALLGS